MMMNSCNLPKRSSCSGYFVILMIAVCLELTIATTGGLPKGKFVKRPTMKYQGHELDDYDFYHTYHDYNSPLTNTQRRLKKKKVGTHGGKGKKGKGSSNDGCDCSMSMGTTTVTGDMDMSFSMCMCPTSAPTISPAPTISSQPTVTFAPSNAPTVSNKPSTSMVPSDQPTISNEPSVSNAPTVTFAPSNAPTVSNQPSLSVEPSTQPVANGLSLSGRIAGDVCFNILDGKNPFKNTDVVPTTFDISINIEHEEGPDNKRDADTIKKELDKFNKLLALHIAGCNIEGADDRRLRALNDNGEIGFVDVEKWDWEDEEVCTAMSDNLCKVFSTTLSIYVIDGERPEGFLRSLIITAFNALGDMLLYDGSPILRFMFVEDNIIFVPSVPTTNASLSGRNESISSAKSVYISVACVAAFVLGLFIIRRRRYRDDNTTHFNLDKIEEATEGFEVVPNRRIEENPTFESAWSGSDCSDIGSIGNGGLNHFGGGPLPTDHDSTTMCSSPTCGCCEWRRQNGLLDVSAITMPQGPWSYYKNDGERNYVAEDTVIL